MQKLSAWRFHDLPPPSKINGQGCREHPNKIEMLQFLNISPAVGTDAALKKGGLSARPAGNSTTRLHCFPARAKGRDVFSWPFATLRPVAGVSAHWGEAAITTIDGVGCS
jgi:hypothetical protein